MMPLNLCSDSEDDPERTPKSLTDAGMWHCVTSCNKRLNLKDPPRSFWNIYKIFDDEP